MTPEKKARAQEIIEELQGTCNSEHDVFTEEELRDQELVDEVSSEIFQCVGCGWWHEFSEESEKPGIEEHQCRDCEPKDEEE